MRAFLALGSLSAATAVAAGAFGAHAMRERVDARMLEVWETAARYQMYHALGLILVAVLVMREEGRETREAGTARLLGGAGWCFVAGTPLFSGSLYAMTLTGVTALGAITPVGGVAFIAGWVALAAAAIRERSRAG